MRAQQRVELRLDRADRNEMAAGAFIDAIEMRASVEEILVAAFGPATERLHVEEERHQRCCAVAHRGVDDLAPAGFLRFQQCGEHADDHVERAAAEIADQVERRHRRFLGADRGKRAGDGDVVDVMTGGIGQRAFLAPAGHAAIDEPWIAREHDFRAEAEPLHHAGAKAFDQRIGAGKQVEHLCDRRLVLEVELDHLAAAARDRLHALLCTDAIERDDLSAHVGQHHAGERTGTDAGEFDDAEARERAGGADGRVLSWFIEHVLFPRVAGDADGSAGAFRHSSLGAS